MPTSSSISVNSIFLSHISRTIRSTQGGEEDKIEMKSQSILVDKTLSTEQTKEADDGGTKQAELESEERSYDVIVDIISGGQKPMLGSSSIVSPLVSSLMGQEDKVLMVIMTTSDVAKSLQKSSHVTLKRSNSWSGRENRSACLGEKEGTDGLPSKAQSYRLIGRIVGQERVSIESTKIRKPSDDKDHEKSPSRTEIDVGQGQLAISTGESQISSGTSTAWPSLIKGAKGITKGTNQLAKKTKKALGHVRDRLKIPSRSDRKSDRSEDVGCDSSGAIEDVSTERSGNLSGRIGLSRSSSLTALVVDLSCGNDKILTKDQVQETNRPPQQTLPRRRPRSKNDLLSASEHVPRVAPMHPPLRRLQSMSGSGGAKHERAIEDKLPTIQGVLEENLIAKATTCRKHKKRSSARDLLSQSDHVTSASTQGWQHQQQKYNRSVLGKDVSSHNCNNVIQTTSKQRRRRGQGRDELTQSEHVPSRSKQIRCASLKSSWGDLTLTSDSDLDDELESEKQMSNPRFSWDLSQLVAMEDLLSAEVDKESSKKEKLKKAFLAVKKKVSGPANDRHVDTCSSLKDSCDNVSLFDDSYQQDFVFQSIDSGMVHSRRNSDASGITSGSSISAMSGPTTSHLPISSRCLNEDTSSRTEKKTGFNMDRNETMDRPSSCRTLKGPPGKRNPSRPRRCSSVTNLRVCSPPETPKTSRAAVSRKGWNGEKKPSSWRDLYSQSSPGQGGYGRRPTGSQVRRTASKICVRQNSADEDITSPRTVAMVEISPTMGQSDNDRESKSESLTIVPTTSAPRRRQGRHSSASAGGDAGVIVPPTAPNLELFHW